jgi:heptosyltransferase-2
MGPEPITSLLSDFSDVACYDPARSYKQDPFDLGFCFPLSFRSAYELWRVPCKQRIGYAHEGRSFFLSRRLDYDAWQKHHHHQVTYYQEMVQSAFHDLTFLPPKLSVPEPRRREAMSRYLGRLDGDEILLGVNPGAFFGSAKTWPSSYFISLLSRLLIDYPNIRIILFSGGKDREKADVLEQALPKEKIVPLQGKTSLPDSLAILSGCNYLLTNDSGMMHMGAALGIPGAVFFGPTDPVSTGPLGGKIRILSHHVTCAPCLLRECPIDHRCMTGLTWEAAHGPIFEDLRKIQAQKESQR